MAVTYGDIGNSWIQLNRETVYNRRGITPDTTSVTEAADGRTNIIGGDFTAKPALLEEMNLSSAGNSPPVATLTTTEYTGTINMKAYYAGTCIQRLLASAYGKHTRTAASTYWDHTYTEESTLPSLQIQRKMYGIPTGANVGVVYTGVIVQGFTFKCGAGIGKEGVGTFDFDLYSPYCNSNTSTGITLNPIASSPPASPGTITVEDPVLWKHGVMTSVHTMSDGTSVGFADIRMKSMEFKRENNIDVSRYYIGSAWPDGARRSAAGEHTMTMTVEFQTLEAFNLFKTYGAAATIPKVLFRGALLGGSTYKEMEFGLGPAARLTGFTIDSSGYGIPTCTLTWRGHYDAAALYINGVNTLGLIGSGYVRVQNGVDIIANYVTT